MNNTVNTIKKEVSNVSAGFTAQDIKFIKKQFFPQSASERDIEFCLKVAQTLELNPIKREIFFIERKENINGRWHTKIEPLTSRDGFLSIAHKTGNFAGIESYCKIESTPKLVNGKWEENVDLIAIAKVWRKDSNKPTIVEVEFSEYAQYKKDGNLTHFWAKMPKTMLKKVAESQALRKAFNISGIYGVEEMGVGLVDKELKIDEEAIEAQVEETEAENTNKEEVKKALSQMGLEVKEKDGWMAVSGNTYNHAKTLKDLGFKFYSSKKMWLRKVA